MIRSRRFSPSPALCIIFFISSDCSPPSSEDMNRTIDEPDARELELRAASVVKASAALRPESSLSRAIRARLLQRMVTVWARQSRGVAVTGNEYTFNRWPCNGRAPRSGEGVESIFDRPSVAAVRGQAGVGVQGRSLFFLLFDFVRQCSSPWLAFHLFYQKHPTLPPYSETPKHLLAALLSAPAPVRFLREQNDSKHEEPRSEG